MDERIKMLDLLDEELDRLFERFADEPAAVEALQAVRCWAIEERVEDA